MRFLWISIFALFAAHEASAALMNVSIGFSYSRTNYSDYDYNWNRRLSFGFGFPLTAVTELEFGYQDVVDRTFIRNYQDTKLHDRIYSANLVQYLLPKTMWVQPYVKGGVGQLNRDATGTYANGEAPAQRVDSLTGILGGGVKLYFSQQFAVRAEGTTYLTGAKIGTWRDNIAGTIGVTWAF